jgi:HEAT repeat protein
MMALFNFSISEGMDLAINLFPQSKINGMKSRGNINGLIQALGDDNTFIRLYAAEALGDLNDRVAVNPLINALNDKEFLVRSKAVEALGKIGDDKAVKPLLRMLNDRDKEVSIIAFKTLCDYRFVEALIIILEETERDACINAIKILEKIDDVRAIEPIMKMVYDPDAEIRNTAALALKNKNIRITPREAPVIKETIREIVKIPCKYCGTLVLNTSVKCPSCGAPLNPFK